MRSASRLAATVAMAAVLPLGLSACGAKVSEAEISAKLKTDPTMKALSDKQRECFAQVMLKKGNKGDLRKWIDGKKKIDDVRGDTSGTDDEARKCVTA